MRPTGKIASNVPHLFGLCLALIFLAGTAAWAQAQGAARILEGASGPLSTGEFTGYFPNPPGKLLASETFLTHEELDFMKRRLLPSYYPELRNRFKRARKKGLSKSKSLKKVQEYARSLFPNNCQSNFTADFGNPDRMLAWAKEYDGLGSLEDLITSVKIGDVLLSGPRNPDQKKRDLVCLLTNGPFHHAVLVIDGPPPIFIEAMGITAQWGDSRGDRVRYGTWYEFFEPDDYIRLLRPTQGRSPTEARRLIADAVSYATRQLGKPYDYGFSNADDQVNFYCSELIYKAWRDGAGMTGLLPQKSPYRDRLLMVLNDTLEALVPKDRFKLNDRIVTFTLAFQEAGRPDPGQAIDFLADEFIPGCRLLEAAFPTPEAREQVRRAGKSLLKSGRAPLDSGAMFALIHDHLLDWAVIFIRLSPVFYHHLATLVRVFPEDNRDSFVPFSPGAPLFRETAAWALYPGEVVRSWPLIGPTLTGFLPGGRQMLTSDDFVSPTDLADMSPVIKEYP